MPDSKAIEVRQDVAAMSEDELRRTYSVAKALASSRRFPSAKTADEAFAAILLGRDLGLSPTQALTGLHIVEGKPQIAAVTLAGFVRKSERYDYSIEEHDEAHCTILFWVDGDEGGRSTFTIAEAKAAGLVKPKGNWEKWPRNMLFARAMSNGVKWYCPDLMGGVPVYTEADTFERTATELAAGEGDGQPVGWQGISVEDATRLEAILDRAKAIGHGGYSDRATVEMVVNGLPHDVVKRWIDGADENLDRHEQTQKTADVILDAAETPAEPEEPVDAA